MQKFYETEEQKLTKRLCNASSKITTSMVLSARANRNWSKYDNLSPVEKLRYQINELNTYIIANR